MAVDQLSDVDGLDTAELTLPERQILEELQYQDELTTESVAELLACDHDQAIGELSNLEEDGLVERVGDDGWRLSTHDAQGDRSDNGNVGPEWIEDLDDWMKAVLWLVNQRPGAKSTVYAEYLGYEGNSGIGEWWNEIPHDINNHPVARSQHVPPLFEDDGALSDYRPPIEFARGNWTVGDLKNKLRTSGFEPERAPADYEVELPEAEEEEECPHCGKTFTGKHALGGHVGNCEEKPSYDDEGEDSEGEPIGSDEAAEAFLESVNGDDEKPDTDADSDDDHEIPEDVADEDYVYISLSSVQVNGQPQAYHADAECHYLNNAEVDQRPLNYLSSDDGTWKRCSACDPPPFEEPQSNQKITTAPRDESETTTSDIEEVQPANGGQSISIDEDTGCDISQPTADVLEVPDGFEDAPVEMQELWIQEQMDALEVANALRRIFDQPEKDTKELRKNDQTAMLLGVLGYTEVGGGSA